MNGPALAARGPQVAVAWHTEAEDDPRVRVAVSSDTGATFTEPLDVHHGTPLGRVDLVMMDGTGPDLLISYLSQVDDGCGLFVRRVQGRALGPPALVATLAGSRADGCPRMVQVGDRALIAWTATDETHPKVKCAWIEPR